MARHLILRTMLSPGDVCTLTAAVESLHATYPGRYVTDVRTSCDALFEHNPLVTKLADGEGEVLEMHYTESVNRSDDLPDPFLRGYCRNLGRQLGVPLEPTTNRPPLYLSPDERNWMS